MHELSIAANIVDAVSHEMTAHSLDRIEGVALRIGRMTDVDSDALAFSFEVLTRETPLEHTRLSIESVSVAAQCKQCFLEFEVEQCLFICPSCHASAVQVIRGMELEIAYLEVEDASGAPDGST